jgi:hypothetical protein
MLSPGPLWLFFKFILAGANARQFAKLTYSEPRRPFTIALPEG